MSDEKTSWLRPKILRTTDLQALRYSLGIPFREMFYLLGFPKALERSRVSSTHEEGPTLAPSLAILVRMLWEHPEDNPFPTEPDFQEIRKMFATVCDRRGRDGLASQGWLSVLLGFRKNNGNEWANGNIPSPVTRRAFLLLQYYLERHGAEEAMRRWEKAAEEEARARGTTIEEVFKTGRWPRTSEEKIAGGSKEHPGRYNKGRRKIRPPEEAEDDGE
ncbi:hypothetical protein AB4090_05190 [Acidithiobacillus sp. IBUN Pt1247-S3]|uniref:hypothetical protein n=1 Tax=Acidithiobacillus sp. IBUN Pt1247-S3 TaxID=3166642 RepID=UPI0034E4075A